MQLTMAPHGTCYLRTAEVSFLGESCGAVTPCWCWVNLLAFLDVQVEKGLRSESLRVVFATSTLAVGIHVPCRTYVMCSSACMHQGCV